ncbi:hypothetical protein [Inquilinus sp. Marseille-Q2685]|uniref:hypothetical protein n=1 Tax=Inquilinus sp. Marseille-Q2685 TaxID=2866581 RepID=UPI001CE401B4|nr:hypothetical protein [Inquilinus sp. Marseille-Q2685]
MTVFGILETALVAPAGRKSRSNFYALRVCDPRRSHESAGQLRKGDFVLDVLMLALAAAFFAVGLGYVLLCDRL